MRLDNLRSGSDIFDEIAVIRRALEILPDNTLEGLSSYNPAKANWFQSEMTLRITLPREDDITLNIPEESERIKVDRGVARFTLRYITYEIDSPKKINYPR